MADYHESLQALEHYVEVRKGLINYGCTHAGMDKFINWHITNLGQQQSFGSIAENYVRRLQIIQQELGCHACIELSQLIHEQDRVHQQEQLLPIVKQKANVGKTLSPKKIPMPITQPQTRAIEDVRFPWDDFHPSASQANLPEPQNTTAQPAPTASFTQGPSQHWIQDYQVHDTSTKVVESPITPPTLYISVLSITTHCQRYCNHLPSHPFNIKIGGGANNSDHYIGFTHWLLTDPNQIGLLMWNRDSNLVLVQSFDYVQWVSGETLLIHAHGKDDTRSLASYVGIFFAGDMTKVFEVQG
ncbi:MAG: hypothetical protein Q9186_006826 [Xanthomendoza sp. 1 TL-2023]